MALLNVNPAAEVSQFEFVKAGTYPMRITKVVDRNPGKNDLEVTLEHTTPPSELYNIQGNPLKGKPSSLKDYVMLAFDKQWKLRMLVESAGMEWGDLDPVVDLLGKEVQVVVKIDTYEGEQKNKVGRYVTK